MNNRWMKQLIETANKNGAKMPWARGKHSDEWASNCRMRLELGYHANA